VVDRQTSKQPEHHFLASLSLFQKVLLITDGTVTELLEQYLNEAIKVIKLYEGTEGSIKQLSEIHQPLVDVQNLPVLKRITLLQGQKTHNNWVYAESTVLLNNLAQGFREDLMHSREPIGKLWSKYRIETYKSIIAAGREQAGELAAHFKIQANDAMISRTYTVYSGNKLIMVITEKFPQQFFCG
jgi:chorismate-pyruvate lyase